ncbi:TIR domain-containing protein [Aliivibrio fischeri]|uniref:TIR domain-containing protein n=1 Tax=Aliivibrio fischeri TaxID=668 RepID=UPI0007C46FAF|nr:TIR domain-containing protein [Aliivibrio fischeri]
MKVFLSWSGDLSHKVALTLRDWLPSVIQSIEPYVSSEDIDKGARWSTDIASELADSSYGILCVTKENLHAPWLTFEAGALSKTMDKSYVSPFLFDIKRSEVNGPILQFQSTVFEKDDVKKLLLSLNKADSGEQLTVERLEKALDVWYPDLEKQLNSLLQEQPNQVVSTEQEPQESFSNPILEEILDLSRVNQKLLRNPELDVHKELDSLKGMLQEIISRSEMERELRMRRNKKIHPRMIDELLHMSPRFRKNFTGFQIAISLFREDFPWIYDAGIDLVKTLRSENEAGNKRDAVEAFQELIEFSFEHPMMRDMYRDDKHTYMMMRELPHILRHALELEL